MIRHFFRHTNVLYCLVIAALGTGLFAGQARADLSEDLRAVLSAADIRQDAARFRETAELVAQVAPGGQTEVLDAIAVDMPHRAGLFADWQVAASHGGLADDGGDAEIESAAAPSQTADDGWVKSTMSRVYSVIDRSAWNGRVSLGLQYVSGNSELADYAFALHLDRDLNADWDLASKLEYFYTESDGAITRDNWLAEARLDRTIEGPWGAYGGANLERDELGNFRDTAFLTAGVSYHAVERESLDWQLRAGAGARYVDPDRPGQDAETSMVGEFGSVFAWALSDTARIGAETTLFTGDASRIEQRLGLVTMLREAWSLDTAIRARHEFEPAIGSEATDTRFTVSVGRDF